MGKNTINFPHMFFPISSIGLFFCNGRISHDRWTGPYTLFLPHNTNRKYVYKKKIGIKGNWSELLKRSCFNIWHSFLLKAFTLAYLGISCLQSYKEFPLISTSTNNSVNYMLPKLHILQNERIWRRKKYQVILANLEKIKVFARIHYNDMQDLYNSQYV